MSSAVSVPRDLPGRRPSPRFAPRVVRARRSSGFVRLAFRLRRVIPYGHHGSTTASTQGNTSLWQPPSPAPDPRPDRNPDPQLRRFLQHETPWQKRKDQGIEGVLREIFPIESYDKTLRLEYIRYELGKPRYEPDECRQLRLTYGRPFKVWLRLTKEQPIEEEVYLGDIPIMLGGGEFIINGAERVVVSQLAPQPRRRFRQRDGGHRRTSPAKLPHHPRTRKLDRVERQPQGKPLGPHRPERQVLDHDAAAGDGSEVQRQRQPAAGLLRRPKSSRSTDSRSAAKIEGKLAVGDVIYPADSPRAGEILVECAQKITEEHRRDDLHLRLEAGRGDGRPEDSAALERPGRRQHGQPRGGPAADLSAAAAGQSAAVGKGQGPVPREVLRHEPLPAGPRGPFPHQPQARAGHPRGRR